MRQRMMAASSARCSMATLAAQKCRLGMVVRTVGTLRARVKIGLANLTYNFTRLAWLQGRPMPA